MVEVTGSNPRRPLPEPLPDAWPTERRSTTILNDPCANEHSWISDVVALERAALLLMSPRAPRGLSGGQACVWRGHLPAGRADRSPAPTPGSLPRSLGSKWRPKRRFFATFQTPGHASVGTTRLEMQAETVAGRLPDSRTIRRGGFGSSERFACLLSRKKVRRTPGSPVNVLKSLLCNSIFAARVLG